jgi:hypothetical protein
MLPGPALVLAQDAAEPGSVLRSGGNCVEVAKARNQVLIHDSKNTHGGCVFVTVVDLLRYQIKAVEIWSA